MPTEKCTKCGRTRPEYFADPRCPEGGYCTWSDMKIFRCDMILGDVTCNNQHSDPSGLCSIHRTIPGTTLRGLREAATREERTRILGVIDARLMALEPNDASKDSELSGRVMELHHLRRLIGK